MTATGHAIIGAVIAAKIGNPELAVPIAFASHVLADLTPHWDLGTNGNARKDKHIVAKTAVDISVGFVLSFIMLTFLFPGTNLYYAFFIIITSQLLDWITMPYIFFYVPPFTWFYKFQKKFHWEMDKPWGIIIQAIILILIVILAKIY
ncbi:MAG: hypothetical protein M1524_04270 [Patescibacteria group bacterium]|nr:hypothetical protein [Patescibacteria group bacterium]